MGLELQIEMWRELYFFSKGHFIITGEKTIFIDHHNLAGRIICAQNEIDRAKSYESPRIGKSEINGRGKCLKKQTS